MAQIQMLQQYRSEQSYKFVNKVKQASSPNNTSKTTSQPHHKHIISTSQAHKRPIKHHHQNVYLLCLLNYTLPSIIIIHLNQMLIKPLFISSFLPSISFPFTYQHTSHTNYIPQPEFALYFQHFQHQSINIFQKITNNTYRPQDINQITDDFFHSLTYKKYPNTMIGLLFLSRDLHNGRQTSRRILEYLIRSEEIKVFKCTEATLVVVLRELKGLVSVSHEKIKQSNIRYATAEIIKNNQAVINYTHLQHIINAIISNDRNLVSHRIRFIEISKILHRKLAEFLQLFIEKTYSNSQNEVLTKTLYNILCFFQQFPPEDLSQIQGFYSFLMDRFFGIEERAIESQILYKMHKCFPSYGRDQNGRYFKDLLFEKIVSNKQKHVNRVFNDWNESLFWYSMLTFEFYKFMREREYKYQDTFNYLVADDLSAPALPHFAWQHYNLHFAAINKDRIMLDIIQNVYPQHQKVYRQKVEPRRHQHAITTQNEIKTRISLALFELGYEFKKEIEIKGRFVDFLIADNIVLECDGDYHFDLHSMQYTQSSQFRNLHLLLGPYRLIIIHVYEYNTHRTIAQLKSLLSRKMGCLEKNKAVFVI